MRKATTAISTLVAARPFDQAVAVALAEISAVENTRKEYRRDVDRWVAFCRDREVDPVAPVDGAVVAWMESMRDASPKTRARRISALSSVYRELRRKGVVESNPFSTEEGPRRAKAPPNEPTPIATPDVVRRVLGTCGDDLDGIRDAAMIRLLWSTGMRRVSLLSMTFERLQPDRMGYVAEVIKKGGDTQRVLIHGKAHLALERWLQILRDGGFKRGSLWRRRTGEPMSEREVNRAIEKRARAIGGELSPHMLRVSFLTYNPAGLDAKQDAAGHVDPKTTKMYDRESWRGREAFERMPDVDDL